MNIFPPPSPSLHRLRAAKRASRSLKAVRARRSQLQCTFLTLKSTSKQQRKQLHSQQQQLEAGLTRLRKVQQEKDAVQAKLTAAESKLQEVEVKLTRAEGLVPRLEERCSGLGLEKRKLQGRVAELAGQVEAFEEKLKVRARFLVLRALLRSRPLGFWYMGL